MPALLLALLLTLLAWQSRQYGVAGWAWCGFFAAGSLFLTALWGEYSFYAPWREFTVGAQYLLVVLFMAAIIGISYTEGVDRHSREVRMVVVLVVILAGSTAVLCTIYLVLFFSLVPELNQLVTMLDAMAVACFALACIALFRWLLRLASQTEQAWWRLIFMPRTSDARAVPLLLLSFAIPLLLAGATLGVELRLVGNSTLAIIMGFGLVAFVSMLALTTFYRLNAVDMTDARTLVARWRLRLIMLVPVLLISTPIIAAAVPSVSDTYMDSIRKDKAALVAEISQAPRQQIDTTHVSERVDLIMLTAPRVQLLFARPSAPSLEQFLKPQEAADQSDIEREAATLQRQTPALSPAQARLLAEQQAKLNSLVVSRGAFGLFGGTVQRYILTAVQQGEISITIAYGVQQYRDTMHRQLWLPAMLLLGITLIAYVAPVVVVRGSSTRIVDNR